MQQLVLTEHQQMIAQRDAEIASQFRELRARNPKASDRRIVETIASGRTDCPTSVPGVRLALIRSGAIVPGSKNEKR